MIVSAQTSPDDHAAAKNYRCLTSVYFMSTFSRQRKSRIRNFEARAARSDDVRAYRDWRYITVHPFADEPELLEYLSMSPNQCMHADVLWHTGTDIALIQTSTGSGPPFCTTVSWFGDPPYLSIIARLPTETTTISQLHDLMDRIAAQGLPKRFRDRQTKTMFNA